jgi:phosphatidylglycerophosphatase A
MKSKTARLIATWFGCGYSPVAPGTVGSLAALAIAWPLAHYAGWQPLWFLAPVVVLTGPSIWAADVTARESGQKDPQIVVVDEVLGQWLALAGARHLNIPGWIAAFLLFRLFDIWKPFPINRLEDLPGGTGIIADDLMAGVYAALILAAAGYLL